MDIYKAVIVDDEINNISLLRHFVSKYCLNVEIVAQALTIEEAISVINTVRPDILFLDIRLNGKEVFEALNKLETVKSQVLFVTSHDEYALKAIKYNAVDYILKPIIIEELVVAINKAIKKIEQQNYFDFSNGTKINKIHTETLENKDYIAVVSQDKIELLKTNDIMYIVSDSKHATFHLINGEEHMSNKNLIFYESVLDKSSFFRIHRTYIVNMRFISKLIKKNGYYCELVDETLLPIAKRKQEEFNRFLKIRE